MVFPQIYKIMSIIKADFDWISLLIMIGAGIIGLIKAQGKGKRTKTSPRRYTSSSEDKKVEWFNIPAKEEVIIEKQEESILAGDYYRAQTENKSDEFQPMTEEVETENTYSFDVRQAIISNEILRRPEY